MPIPPQIIANADDLGLNPSVNRAILYCFEQGYINSTSLLTNMDHFDETVNIIHKNPVIANIGIHVNFAEGRPITNFKQPEFIDDDGNWNLAKTGTSLNKLTAAAKSAFLNEINAQIERAITSKIKIVHIDSHLHLHTLPAFCGIFIKAAKAHRLKLRLAQTYKENSYLKFYYRKYINSRIKKNNINYSDLFENVQEFMKHTDRILGDNIIEIMVHPDFDASGKLMDNVEQTAMKNWLAYLNLSQSI